MSRRGKPMGNKRQRERDKARKKKEKEARREARLAGPEGVLDGAETEEGAEPAEGAEAADGTEAADGASPVETPEAPAGAADGDEVRRDGQPD